MNIISKTIESIRLKVSPSYRELKAEEARRQAYDAQRAEAWEKRKDAIRKESIELLKSIIGNCPKGSLIFVKFACGNWREEQMAEMAAECKAHAKENGFAYLNGSGLACVDPDRYGRNAERVINKIYSWQKLLMGTRIHKWRYVSLVD